jgi:hypothetical protein
MGQNDLLFENTGVWDQAQLRQRDDLTVKPYFGYNVAENAERVRGTYRPSRNLPAQFRRGNRDDNEAFVFAQGKFLSKYDQIINSTGWKYQDDTKKLGVSSITTGEFYAFTKASGGAQLVKSENDYWGANGDIEGFIMPANGSNVNTQDFYGTIDAQYGIINPVTGSAITDAAVAAGVAASLRDGLAEAATTAKIAGVSIADTMRETRNNAYQYQRKIGALTVAKEGYLRLPFVIADVGHAGFTAIDDAALPLLTYANWTAFLAAAAGKQYLASKDQTSLFVESPAQLLSNAPVYIDRFGNPCLLSSGTAASFADPADFGAVIRLVDFNFSVRMPFGDETTSYPGIEVASNETGGIDFPVWSLAKKLESSSLTTKQLADLIIGGTDKWYGYATIYYDIP